MNLTSHIANLVRTAQSNFYYAFLFLPKSKREAIFAAYAFSRHTDDIVDEAENTDSATRRLDKWRSELLACYDGSPSHPITINLQQTLQNFPIPKEHFLHLIEGVEMDLCKNRYATFKELYEYCYRVASVIGLISIEIFGYGNPNTKKYAVNLGVALQLTNILRDIKKDEQQNRIYLPTEDLKRFGYSEEDLRTCTYNQAFMALMAFQCKRAREYYEQADFKLPQEDKARMFSAEIMGHIYSALLRRIESQHFNVFDRPVQLNHARKLGIALRFWLGSKLSR